IADDSAGDYVITHSTIPHRCPCRVCSIATASERGSYIALPNDASSSLGDHFCIQVYANIETCWTLRCHHRPATQERLNIHLMARHAVNDRLVDSCSALPARVRHCSPS